MKRRKSTTKLLTYSAATAMLATSFAGIEMLVAPAVVSAADDVIMATGEGYEFNKSSGWDEKGTLDLDLTKSETPKVGTKLAVDVLLPVTDSEKATPGFAGEIKTQGIIKVGEDWTYVQSGDCPALSESDFNQKVTIDGKEYYKATVSYTFGEKVGANDPSDNEWSNEVDFDKVVTGDVKATMVKVAGSSCDYSGDVIIANAKFEDPVNTDVEYKEPTVLSDLSSEEDFNNWNEEGGWDYSHGVAGGDNTAPKISYDSDNERLKVSVDYSANKDKGWSEAKVKYTMSEAADISGYNRISVDVIYPKDFADSFKIKLYSKGTDEKTELINADLTVNDAKSEDTEDGLRKQTVTFSLIPSTVTMPDVTVGIVGTNTAFKGDVYLDNLTLSVYQAPDTSVDSTVAVKENNSTVGLSGTNIVLNGKQTAVDNNVTLVDKDASANTKLIYSYLKAVGKSDGTIFGHQNDTTDKAGTVADKTTGIHSDVYDVTGSISGIIGIDALSLTGDEFGAKKSNTMFGTNYPETTAGNVQAAADVTNRNIKSGAIITMSAHMPNFSIVKENKNYNPETDKSYEKYDFSGYSPNVLTGDVMNNILPGGAYNEQYTAYLDMIADYASQVDGTILFRPFHEGTGSWFWWGSAFCDASTFKNVYKYTVEYLRDTKNIHNMLYVYGPGSEAESVEEYAVRYPGDDYVDMVGFDMYNKDPNYNDGWIDNFKNTVNTVETFAKQHNKLFAVTETGMGSSVADEGHSQTVLHETGNEVKDWHSRVLEALDGSEASFYLTWGNWAKNNGYYTPYVDKVNDDGTLHGHETLDAFIEFYNDSRSIFAVDQKKVLEDLASYEITASATTQNATGYITMPVSGMRILTSVTLKSNVKGAGNDTVKYVFTNGKKSLEVNATIDENGQYSATLTEDQVKSLRKGTGTIDLYAGSVKLDSISAIFNIPEPEKDIYRIDNFDDYSGSDTLLTGNWASNKDSGCSVSFNLTKENASEGYGLAFSYDETKNGWGGATITKDVDWTDCNALQFWTIPDGNNQKVVIQINANGNCYETYLNLYDDYANAGGKPILVTIPFSEFVARDVPGNPKGGLVDDRDGIQSFGLWVNAIADSDAVKDGRVKGTIYYDSITAVYTDSEEATFEVQKASQAELKISGIPDELHAGDKFTLKTEGGNGNGEVKYEVVDGHEYASVDTSTGEVTVKGNGTVTIKVTKAGDNEYNETEKTVTFTSKPDGTVLSGGINGYTSEDLEKIIPLTDEEKELLEYAENEITVKAEIKDISATVTDVEKAAVGSVLDGFSVGEYLDISLYKTVGNNAQVRVDKTTGKLNVSIGVPEKLLNKDASKDRIYKIVKIHDGKVEVIDGTFDAATGTFTFATDEFSTYALIYKDVDKTAGSGSDTNGQTGTDTSKVSGDVETADKAPIASLFSLLLAGGAGILLAGRKKKKVTPEEEK